MVTSPPKTSGIEKENKNPLLTRFKPLIYTDKTSCLEIHLDPICSRSFITVSTLGKYFPELLMSRYPSANSPNRPTFKESVAIRAYELVDLPLEFKDMENKILGIQVTARVCDPLEEGLDGKVVLGTDFLREKGVSVCWAEEKKKESGSKWWKAAKEEDVGFLGLVIGESRVRFERPVQASRDAQ